MLAREAKGLKVIGLVNRHAVEAGPEGEYEDDRAWLECWHEVSGKPLDPELVKKARQEEIGFFRRKGVHKKVPIEEAWKNTGKSPIRVKWVDVNTGDDDHPEYRSRLVAAELKTDQRPDQAHRQRPHREVLGGAAFGE